MGISCEEVWRDISDYIDEDLDPIQQAALDQHFVECRHCTALLDGMRNVIALYRDERVLAPPDGFHQRLYQRLGENTKNSRRSFLAWTLTAAAAVPLGLALLSARRLIVPAHDPQRPRSGPDSHQVPEMVAISQDQDVESFCGFFAVFDRPIKLGFVTDRPIVNLNPLSAPFTSNPPGLPGR